MEFDKVCNADKLIRELKSFDIDYITYHNAKTLLYFKRVLTAEEKISVTEIVNSHTLQDDLKVASSRREKAIRDFEEIMDIFVSENISMGITQAGKTKLIQDVLQHCIEYGKAGSLTEAIREANEILILPEYAPFITLERKDKFLSMLIEAYNAI